MPQQSNNGMYWLLLIPIAMFCLMGLLLGALNGDPGAGFLWGGSIGIVTTVVIFLGMNGWEKLKDEMSKGKLYPYVTVGVLAAAALAGYMAFNLGNPSCEEYDSGEPRSSCVQYADNGYEATTEQRWEEFWKVFPVAAIIGGLIATIVHHNIHPRRK